ncbi:MAG TPA: NAD(P)-dependent alcohol dehydrogenase [Candidatus Limnocylindrales bacterium]|nr:NAD(P)-dependent alcohol dehydrogenase [Candidatus Limnocylindrales bacterium]
MKAIVRHRYGSPDVLRLEDVDMPVVGDDQVLIRVRAASVNAYDWHVLRGLPYLVRIEQGLREPKTSTTGVDLAGEVEAVGKDVSEFRPGDAVFGERDGAFAEYVSGRAVNFAPKPSNLTFEQAAAVPMAGYTALQALRDKGQIQAGQKVLVNGASGGVGSFAVQIASAVGAEVTGVCSTRNLELVRSIGADHVIDYTGDDFTRGAERYDLIIDIAATRPLRDCRRVLTPNGRLVIVGAAVGHADGRWIGPMIRPAAAAIISRFVKERLLLPFLAHRSKDDLLVLKSMIESGTVTPLIDRAYPLAQTAEAIRYVEAGHARGKVVITI